MWVKMINLTTESLGLGVKCLHRTKSNNGMQPTANGAAFIRETL
jgi:hypothetical protein